MQNPIITVIYSHGTNGSPWYGVKIEHLRLIALKLGINVISIRYQEDLSIEEMEDKLFKTVTDTVNVPGDLVFLGSSRGAYLTTRISQKVVDFYNNEPIQYDNDKILPKRNVLGQFLISPAFYVFPDYFKDQDISPAKGIKTTIIHGYDDEIVNYENIIKFATKYRSELYLIEESHRMNSQVDKLCALFEIFLKDCQKKSYELFEE